MLPYGTVRLMGLSVTGNLKSLLQWEKVAAEG